MRAALAALLLALALPGCAGAAADLEVRARNHTAAPVEVSVWINHTGEPSWHRVAVVAAGSEAVLGRFDGPARDDYSMVAVAGGLRLERASQQLGGSYPRWDIAVHPDRIDDGLMVY